MRTASPAEGAPPAHRTHFARSERLITTLGACTFGAMIGFALAFGIGRYDIWALFLGAAVVLGVALYPAAANLSDSQRRRSPGCRIAARLHVAALLAWPLVIHVSGALYWLVAATALSSLLLLASCWTGRSRVVYRIGAQGVIIAALAAHQGTMLVMGA